MKEVSPTNRYGSFHLEPNGADPDSKRIVLKTIEATRELGKLRLPESTTASYFSVSADFSKFSYLRRSTYTWELVVVDAGIETTLCCGETVEKFSVSDYPPEVDEILESSNALLYQEIRDPSLNFAGTSITFISDLFEDYENEINLIEFDNIGGVISLPTECERIGGLHWHNDRYLCYYPEEVWETSCSKSDKTTSPHSLLENSEYICVIDVAKRKVMEPDVLDEGE